MKYHLKPFYGIGQMPPDHKGNLKPDSSIIVSQYRLNIFSYLEKVPLERSMSETIVLHLYLR